MSLINKCQLVRSTCLKVVKNAKNVRLVPERITNLATKFNYTSFNEFQHHNITKNDQQQILTYLLMLDSLNFCFWPLEGFEYEDLANNVKNFIENNPGVEGLQKLSEINEEGLKAQIFGGVEVPLADERARIMREMSSVVLYRFNGSVKSIIESAEKSVVHLLDTLTKNFPNFQDHSIYRGSQIHFYKRAQIFIGDIWAKFQGKGIGEFTDIEQLTMFPDYRVPQILWQHGILQYEQNLKNKVQNLVPVMSGSQEQIEIRAFSVHAVELMKEQIQKQTGKSVHSIQTDWFLWEQGQKNLKTIKPHHRTLTIYY